MVVFLLFLFVAGWCVLEAWRYTVAKRQPRWWVHRLEVVAFVGLILIICTLSVILGRSRFDWFAMASLLLLAAAIRWVIFDIVLNLYRRLPWDYVPRKTYGARSSLADRLLRRLPFFTYSQFIFKGAALIAAIFIYVEFS